MIVFLFGHSESFVKNVSDHSAFVDLSDLSGPSFSFEPRAGDLGYF